MITPARIPGRYGRRKPDLARPALRLGNYLTGAVPAHPAAADYLARMGGGWLMLGNDQAGDCVSVTWANFRRLVSTFLGTASYPSQDEVWAFYKTQNPGFDPAGSPSVNGPGSSADQGMDIQAALGYLVKNGGPDGVKAIGFAKVNHADPDEVKAAIALFGGVWTGIYVQSANQQQFAADQPWSWDPRQQPDGGHSVLTGGYGAAAAGAGPALGGDEKFITWAAETSFTDEFWADATEECWVVIWPEHLGSGEFLDGVDLAQFAADYTAITGRPFPAQVPPAPEPPAPAPVPPVPAPPPAPPAPADADTALWATAGPWCEKTRVRPDLARLKDALLTWAETNGLS